MDDLLVTNIPRGRSVAVALAQCLALPADERDALFDSEHVGLRIVSRGVAHELLSFGPLGVLAAQLGPTMERLRAGQSALLRSGVLDESEGLYVLFEPADGGAAVVASTLWLEALPRSHSFALPPWSPETEGFYAWVAAHRDALLEAGQRNEPLREVALERNALLAAMERERALVVATLAALGEAPAEL